MSRTEGKFPLAPIQILGVLIMLGMLVAATVYGLAWVKPMAIQMKAEGRWTMGHEILYKIPLVLLFAVGYFGYTLAALPQEGWSWRRAAKSGIEAVIVGAIAGLLVSLAQRGW